MNRRQGLLLATSVSLVLGLAAGCSDADPAAPSASSAPATASAPEATAGADAVVTAQMSAEWLLQAADGATVFQTEFDGTAYDDYGLTADVVLALLSADDASAARTFADALSTPEATAAYVGDGTVVQYAGSTAKLLAAASAAGVDAGSIGGRDLAAELTALMQPSGRFSDLGDEDYSHTISQSWGVLALAGQDGAPTAAVDYLSAQQCSGAGFPAQLADTPSDACLSDVDSTAFAISALIAAKVPASSPAVTDALAWLGSVSATSSDEGTSWAAAGSSDPSVNSTAVVATAFVDAGQDASEAVTWLQAAATSEGVEAGSFDLAGTPDARSTAQATAALAGVGLVSLVG